MNHSYSTPDVPWLCSLFTKLRTRKDKAGEILRKFSTGEHERKLISGRLLHAPFTREDYKGKVLFERPPKVEDSVQAPKARKSLRVS
ncbi:hypothetical protein E2C01_098401 [Portunus trituberculatus]|uniref:Uncharacterized protein n=1 Tax=Portunus trituberculatus TaxID=210409 RepID=A0A5B7K8A7_PORTR|nr:hypothetical protein [Portunus trituberculatus]